MRLRKTNIQECGLKKWHSIYWKKEMKIVTRRVKRNLASLSYMMQRAYWKIVTAKPSVLIFAVVVIAASIFLLGGGLYDLLEKPLFAIFIQERFIGVYPYSLNEQLLAESIFVMLVYAMAAGGFLLTYQSTKYAYRPRQAFMFLLIGIVFIIVAYIAVEYAFLARWRLG